MRFGEIVGHSREKEILRSLVDRDRIPHALLLHGPSGIGKMNIARAFVQYVNCTRRDGGDSCGKCPACLQTSKFNNPDVHYIYPVVKKTKPTKEISEDYAGQWKQMLADNEYMPFEKWLDILDAKNSQPQIFVAESEEILRLSSLSSYAAKYKIFIVWLPEKMNQEAANKLLKVIEEPHEDTLFVLVSNDPGSILPTILSRLNSVEMKPLGEAEVGAWLVSKGVGEETAAEYARIAKGNLNKAASLIEEKGEMAEFMAVFIDVMRSCYARNMVKLRGLADSLASLGREKAMRLLDYFGRMARENFVSNLKVERLVALTTEERNFTAKFGPFIHSGNIEEMEKEISRAKNDIGRNANQKIVWFDLMIRFMALLRRKESL